MEKIFSKKIIWFLIPVLCLIIAVAAFFLYRSNTSSGLNTDMYIKGGTSVTISVGTDAVVNYEANIDRINAILEKNGVSNASFELSTRTYDDQAKIIVTYCDVKGANMIDINNNIINEIKEAYKDIVTVEDYVAVKSIGSAFNDSVILNALLAFGIAFLLIHVYMLIRYGWANALSGLLSSLVVGVITLSLIIITRTQITSSILGLIAFGMILTAIASVILFDKITHNARKSDFKGTKAEAESIIGLSVKQIFKVSLGIYIFVALAAVALLILGFIINLKLLIYTAISVFIIDIAVCYVQLLFTTCLSAVLMSSGDKKKRKK